MVRLAVNCLMYAKEKSNTDLVLSIHPEDLKELWNTEARFIFCEESFKTSFTEENLMIANHSTCSIWELEFQANPKLPRWLPRIAEREDA